MENAFYFQSNSVNHLSCVNLNQGNSRFYIIWTDSLNTYFGQIKLGESNTYSEDF